MGLAFQGSLLFNNAFIASSYFYVNTDQNKKYQSKQKCTLVGTFTAPGFEICNLQVLTIRK